MAKKISIAALSLLAWACSPDTDTARGVAESFLDEHYVRMDLQAASELCTGLARAKVADEIRLIEGQEIDGSTMKPSVSYELEEERPSGDDRTTFLYQGNIRLGGGGGTFAMKWLINVRREEGQWRVSNFKEMQ